MSGDPGVRVGQVWEESSLPGLHVEVTFAEDEWGVEYRHVRPPQRGGLGWWAPTWRFRDRYRLLSPDSEP